MRHLIVLVFISIIGSNMLFASAFTEDLRHAKNLVHHSRRHSVKTTLHKNVKRSREVVAPEPPFTPVVTRFDRDASYEVYFSPNGRAARALINAIDNTKETADIAIYSINHPGINAAIKTAIARGVEFRFVCDKTEAGLKTSSTRMFAVDKLPMHIQHGTKGGVMHMKVGIFDKVTVALGSFNYTGRADVKNDEILMIIHGDSDLVERCQEKFDALWERMNDVVH